MLGKGEQGTELERTAYAKLNLIAAWRHMGCRGDPSRAAHAYSVSTVATHAL